MRKYKLLHTRGMQKNHNGKVNALLEELDRESNVVGIKIHETIVNYTDFGESTFSTVITWEELWSAK